MANYIDCTIKILSRDFDGLNKFLNLSIKGRAWCNELIFNVTQTHNPAFDYALLFRENPNCIFAIRVCEEQDLPGIRYYLFNNDQQLLVHSNPDDTPNDEAALDKDNINYEWLEQITYGKAKEMLNQATKSPVTYFKE